MKENLSVIKNVDNRDWEAFIRGHPQGNIFQSPQFYEVHRQTKNYEPVVLAVMDETGNLHAILQSVLIRELNGPIGSLSSHAVIEGGPLFSEGKMDSEVMSVLLKEYDRIAEKSCLYSEIRNKNDTSNMKSLFHESGYEFVDHLNFLIDLRKTKEELWRQISRSMRKNINKSLKKGVEVEEMDNKNLIPTFYGFLQDVYRSVGIPLPDISHFYSIYELLVPKEMAKFHLAKYNGEYVGGRLSLLFDGRIHAYFVGVPEKYKKLNVNPLLNWHIIEWGFDNGYSTFDFGGAGKPEKDYGVREFKRQFGGELVNFGRYSKIHSPIKMKLAEKGFKIYKKMLM
ncbi:MAG: lipid II:glycine glycyltransferase FemX [Halobacteriota archaeon]